jgi:lipopolysaccharide export system permease protein
MKILYRYYFNEFFKILSIISLGIALIFSLIDLLDKIDNFIPGKLSIADFAYYALLNMPKYLYYLLPMSLLICSLFVFSQASRFKELAVVKASGCRLKRLFYPFVVVGLFFSAVAFIFGEVVVPDFSDRIIEFKKNFMKGGEKVSFREGTLWLRGTDGALVRIELYTPEQKLAKGISIFLIEQAAIKKRIETEEALWIEKNGSAGAWKFMNSTVYDIGTGTIETVPEMVYPYLESPDFFGKRIKNPEEMGIGELYRYASKLQSAGFNDAKLIVDLNSKISYPMMNMFFIVFGISFSVIGRAGGGLFAAGIGIFISLLYWLLYTFMLSLGYAGILPPAVSTWIVPLLFGAASFYLFMKIPE